MIFKRDNKKYFEISEKYYIEIYRYCLSQLKDKSYTKEATNDTFLRLWNKGNILKNDEKIIAWLYNTADNFCKSINKETAKIRKIELSLEKSEDK
ncbi:MAG: hypothetical protein IJZ89_01855 [Clostridia bacterium]|nr:hypothetical protein [Clostridia bacterium]